MSHAASITLTGRVGTDLQLSSGLTGDRVTFRVVATERRFDRDGQGWVDGDEFGVRVICWRGLAAAVAATVRRGDPVVVVGRIATRRFEKEGATQYFTEVKADTVGLDVARVGGRIARKQPDAFGSASGLPDGNGHLTGSAGHIGSGAPGDDPFGAHDDLPEGQPHDDLPPEPDECDDPWGRLDEPEERPGELVGSG